MMSTISENYPQSKQLVTELPDSLNIEITEPQESIFQFADDLGPSKIIHIYEPITQLKAIVVVDNTVCGPAIGGVRMAVDVTTTEVFRLARAMTLKNAVAELPHGGGKSAILADPKLPLPIKERLIRTFARAIKDITEYIPGPDMGTNEQCMAWIKQETGRAVGLPRTMGGIPLDEIGATGFGISVCAEVASKFCNLDLHGARIVIQGFGSVGKHAARFLTAEGAILIAAADSQGTLFNPQGINVHELIAMKESGKSVIDYPNGEKLHRDAVIDIECDIWIPAARPDIIHTDNVNRLHTRLIISGANIPLTEDAERKCHERQMLVVPDFIANAGGVICAAVEYGGGTQADALPTVAEKIRHNTALVLETAAKTGILPRQAAVELAQHRANVARKFSGQS